MEHSNDKDIILVAGAPGTGKTHLGQELAKQLNTDWRSVEHVSFGDRIRRIAGEVGSLAVPASAYTDTVTAHLANPETRRQLLDNETAMGIASEIFSQHTQTDLLLLDGYPRNLDQYTDLEQLLAFHPATKRNFRGIIVTTTTDQMALTRLVRRNPRHLEEEITPEIALDRLTTGRHDLGNMLDNYMIRTGPWYREIDTSGAKSHTLKLGIEAVHYFMDNPYKNVL